MSKLHQRFGTKPLTVRHKELRVRIVTLVQSSGEQRSSRQRLVGGCPTFKTHLVPHWRESRCSTGGGGNQPTKQLFWQRMLCCWKDGNMRLWIEEWDIYWSTVINLYHHKLDLFRWRETTDARKEGVVESANLAPKSQWRQKTVKCCDWIAIIFLKLDQRSYFCDMDKSWGERFEPCLL